MNDSSKNRQLKILVVAPTPFFSDRGTHIRILEEALALEKLGHEVTIATYHIGKNIDPRVGSKIDVRRILRLLFWYKKLEAGPDWQKIILDLMLIRKVFFLTRTKKPNIIHGHLHEGALIGWIVQKLFFWRNIKLVADFHGSLTKEMISHDYLRGGWLRRFFLGVEKFIDNLGDYAVTSSWENTSEIKGFRRDGKVDTILDGVNLDYYQKFFEKKQLREKYGVPQDKLVVTYTGALMGNKGISYLFEAIKIAADKDQNLYFVVGGFPTELAEKFIKDNNFENRMKLISPLNYFDLPEVLCLSDLGIDPKDSSTRQASGKILQYMAAGLPVVCFDRENNREYLGEGGYFSSDVSGRGIADGILYLSENAEVIERMKKLNMEKAKELSWIRPAEKLSGIYQDIIKQ